MHRVLSLPGRLPLLREHDLHEEFIGPRLMVHNAALEMHPLDTGDRLGDLKDDQGIGYCNITKCCTNVLSRGYYHHGQRHHSLKGKGRRRVLRPAQPAPAHLQV